MQYEKLFAGLRTEVEAEIDAVEICKEFGWTYYEYIKTPLWFLETVRIRKTTEASFSKKEERKAKTAGKFK